MGEDEAREDLERMLRELQEMDRVLSSVLENWGKDVEAPRRIPEEVVRTTPSGLRHRKKRGRG